MTPEQNIVRLEIGLHEDILNFANSHTNPDLSLSDYIESLIYDEMTIHNRARGNTLDLDKISVIVSDEIQEYIRLLAPVIARSIIEDVFMTLSSNEGRRDALIEISLPAYGWIEESNWGRFEKMSSALSEAIKIPLGGGGIALSTHITDQKTE